MEYIIWNEKERIRQDAYCGDHELEVGDIVYRDAAGIRCYAPWPELSTLCGALFRLVRWAVIASLILAFGVFCAWALEVILPTWLYQLTSTFLVIAAIAYVGRHVFLIPMYLVNHRRKGSACYGYKDKV